MLFFLTLYEINIFVKNCFEDVIMILHALITNRIDNKLVLNDSPRDPDLFHRWSPDLNQFSSSELDQDPD